jgi:hypothetical protein
VDEGFGNVRNVRKLNTPLAEGIPGLTADFPAPDAMLYFTRQRPGFDDLDLWQATWKPDRNGNGIDDRQEPGDQFRRGDANNDGGIDIADAVFTLQYLFGNGTDLSCPDAGDANDDETIDIADAISILDHLFGGGADLPAPFHRCGFDTTGGEEGDLSGCIYNPAHCPAQAGG